MTLENIEKVLERAAKEHELPAGRVEEMRQVLRDAAQQPPVPKHRLTVRRLKVIGRLECDYRFKKGINLLLSEENFAGKSTLLNFIKLGFNPDKNDLVDDQLKPELDAILVEFDLDGQLFTTRRNVHGQGSGIYKADMDHVLTNSDLEPEVSSLGEMKDFYLNLFGLPSLAVLSGQSGDVTKKQRKVGFGDYFRAFYQDQGRGYNEIFSDQFSTRQHVLAVLLGVRQAPLSNRASIMRGELDNATQISQHQIQALRDGLANKLTKLNLSTSVEQALRALAKEIDSLENQIESARATAPQGLALEEADRLAQEASHKLIIAEAELQAARGSQEQEAARLRDLKGELERAEGEKGALVLLQTYYVQKCPRCEQAITADRVSAEQDEGLCRVCARPAPPDDKLVEARTKHIEALQIAITEQEPLLAFANKRVEQAKAARALAETTRDQALAEQTKPVLADLRRAFEELRGLENKLMASKGLQSEIQRDREAIVEFDNRLREDQKAVEVWRAVEDAALEAEKGGTLSNPYESFERHLGECLEHVKKARRGRVQLDPKGILKIGSTRFDDLRPGEQIRACIAVFHTMLRMAVFEEGRLPGFLMVDSPRQQEMDLEDYLSVGRLYATLAEKKADEFQVIIASASPEIASITTPDRVVMIPKGEKSLKRAAGTPA